MRTRKIAQTIILVAMVVVLSPIFIPLGPAKVQPFQHMANVIAGVLLGPWYAVIMATCTAIIRYSQGMGTVFAFPGGIFGAFLAGWFYRWIRALRDPSGGGEEVEAEGGEGGAPRPFWGLPLAAYGAAVGEVIGTGLIGASVSALIVAPFILEKTVGLTFFIFSFSASSIVGAILGLLGLGVLRRAGYWR